MAKPNGKRAIEPIGEPKPDAVGLLHWVVSDPRLAEACAAAVDPLEVAARLETFGLSSRVAEDMFGYRDVFSAAHAVYTSVPFEDTEPPPRAPEPMGRPLDLLRGALYAIPAVFFTVVVDGFGVPTRWWVLLVGLTIAWGISQAVAVVGWALRGRGDERSDSLLACTSILVTAALCFGVALAVRSRLGGTHACVFVAVALGTYIAASGVLLFHRAEWLLGLSLVPAIVGSILGQGIISHRAARVVRRGVGRFGPGGRPPSPCLAALASAEPAVSGVAEGGQVLRVRHRVWPAHLGRRRLRHRRNRNR